MEISGFSLVLVLWTLSLFVFMGFATYRGLLALEHRHLLAGEASGLIVAQAQDIRVKLSHLGNIAVFWGVVSTALLATLVALWFV